jgi:hypothetical protein
LPLTFEATPGGSVWSREIGQGLCGCLVVEAFQSGLIVVGDEGEEIGIAFGMIDKAAVMGGAVLGHAVEVLADASVEALDHAVGLRPEGSGQAVGDGVFAAERIEGVVSRGFVLWFSGFVDGEAVGELGAVVGEDGVDRDGEGGEEAVEKVLGGLAAAVGEDFEIDEAGGAVDGDVGVAAPAIERRQVFDVDMDEAGGVWRFEGEDGGFLGAAAAGQAVALEAAMDGAAREFGVDAAAHGLDDIVEGKGQRAAQFEDEGFFPIARGGGEPMRHMRAVDDLAAPFPARDGALADPQLARQAAVGGGALLDIGPRARCRGGVGMQLHVHDARRSRKKPIACTKPGP